MDKTNPPTTFGVFKPVGHTLIAFRTEDGLQDAIAKLETQGIPSASMVHYTAAEMKRQADTELLAADPLANFGYELDLVREHKKLAEQGCSFLVVETPTDTLAGQVADFVRTAKPAAAQRYGRFMIENLTEPLPGRMGQAS
ncbi:MAG: hypothetical protein V4858_04160 [Pseudomonadota bacterium]